MTPSHLNIKYMPDTHKKYIFAIFTYLSSSWYRGLVSSKFCSAKAPFTFPNLVQKNLWYGNTGRLVLSFWFWNNTIGNSTPHTDKKRRSSYCFIKCWKVFHNENMVLKRIKNVCWILIRGKSIFAFLDVSNQFL